MQERFASIFTACTNERGIVDKTKLLELLRLSPEDPVTLIFDVLIANLEISRSTLESGARLFSQTEKIVERQETQAKLIISEMKSISSKMDRLLEVSSGKTFAALDEIRSVTQGLIEKSEHHALETRRVGFKSAILYFIMGFVTALAVVLMFIYKEFFFNLKDDWYHK